MKKNKLALFSAPYVLWMAVFVVIPILMIVVYAFSSAEGGFTLENFARIGDYMVVFTRSFKLAFIATAICLLLGYPVSCFLAREGPRFQRIAMMLIMLPMWMNFLLRTYAWMSLLENTGLLNRFFEAIGLFNLINNIFGTELEYFKMINTQGAVVLGMVYNPCLFPECSPALLWYLFPQSLPLPSLSCWEAVSSFCWATSSRCSSRARPITLSWAPPSPW